MILLVLPIYCELNILRLSFWQPLLIFFNDNVLSYVSTVMTSGSAVSANNYDRWRYEFQEDSVKMISSFEEI